MVEMTIQVPDDLAQRLRPLRERLPEVLERGLQEMTPSPATIYRQIIEFLASGPTASQLAEYRPTAEAQARVRELLEKNRAGLLSEAERAELDQYERIEHLMIMIKARAGRYVETSIASPVLCIARPRTSD